MMTVEIVKRMKVKKIDLDKDDVVKREVCSRDKVMHSFTSYVRTAKCIICITHGRILLSINYKRWEFVFVKCKICAQ